MVVGGSRKPPGLRRDHRSPAGGVAPEDGSRHDPQVHLTPAVAALLGSLVGGGLTAGGTLGTARAQRRHAKWQYLRDERKEAYAHYLTVLAEVRLRMVAPEARRSVSERLALQNDLLAARQVLFLLAPPGIRAEVRRIGLAVGEYFQLSPSEADRVAPITQATMAAKLAELMRADLEITN